MKTLVKVLILVVAVPFFAAFAFTTLWILWVVLQ